MMDISDIEGLALSDRVRRKGRLVPKGGGAGGGDGGGPPPKRSLPANLQAAVDVGSILSFVSGVDPADRQDVLDSVQLASRAADGAHDRFANTKEWYDTFGRVLTGVGWTGEQFAHAQHKQDQGNFRMDKAALGVIRAIATGNQLDALTASISALEQLAESDNVITLLNYYASKEGSGNYQLGAVQKEGGALSMALGAFHFKAAQKGGKFLFFTWGGKGFEFWTAAQKMTLNPAIYGKVRETIVQKLGNNALDFVAAINLPAKPRR